MNRSLLLCAIFLVSFGASCTKPEVVSAPENSNVTSANRATVIPVPTDQKTPSREANSEPPPNPKDAVTFDGTSYIKKSGWKVPSYRDTYVNEDYQLHDKPVEKVTKNGEKVQTFAKQYLYKVRPRYLEEFSFIGNDLDYLKGPLERTSFIEARVNGRVFLYSVFIRMLRRSNESNGIDGDSNLYQILDEDGDGVFETLLGDYDEIIVPDWVLRRK